MVVSKLKITSLVCLGPNRFVKFVLVLIIYG